MRQFLEFIGSVVGYVLLFLLVAFIVSSIADGAREVEEEKPAVTTEYHNRKCFTQTFEAPSSVKKIRTCVWERDNG